MSEPIVLFVRRGAERRFAALESKTAKMDVKVVWDRRERPRRTANTESVQERRRADRRQPASSTWQLADFCVAVPTSSKK
jgi:hypothetical protein